MGHAIEETIVVKSATNNAWQGDQHLHGLWYSPVRLSNVREYVSTYSGFTPSRSPPITSVVHHSASRAICKVETR